MTPGRPAFSVIRVVAVPGVGIVEIRNYRLVPGERERFVDYFERHFLHTQEAVGIAILGQFRVVDEPDRFAWIRGFPDMRSRRIVLESFYGGPVWAEYGGKANAMMTAWDDVYLLRPSDAAPALAPGELDRVGGDARPPTLVAVVVCLTRPEDWRGAARAAEDFRPEPPVTTLGVLVAEMEPNDFPSLPVLQSEGTVVWVGSAPAEAVDRLTVSAGQLTAAVEQAAGAVEHRLVLLEPTARSLLR